MDSIQNAISGRIIRETDVNSNWLSREEGVLYDAILWIAPVFSLEIQSPVLDFIPIDIVIWSILISRRELRRGVKRAHVLDLPEEAVRPGVWDHYLAGDHPGTATHVVVCSGCISVDGENLLNQVIADGDNVRDSLVAYVKRDVRTRKVLEGEEPNIVDAIGEPRPVNPSSPPLKQVWL